MKNITFATGMKQVVCVCVCGYVWMNLLLRD